MANYQNILRQAHQAIADVADNADSWRAFLRSAAYTTHYAFPNQALIYSQRPGATMLADIDTWNRAAGRWVNRGARGVASLGTGNMAGNVRYLFDIKDTHPAGKAAKPLGWQITDANRYPTLQALQEKHNAESLPEIFGLQAALFVAQHGKQLDADLQNAVIGSHAGMGKAAGANGDFCQPHHAECRLYGGSALRFGRQRRAAGRLCGH